MLRSGKASPLWGRGYDPSPPQNYHPPPGLRYKPAIRPVSADPMADLIEEGAEWWLARGDRSPIELQAAFNNSAVGCVLYETVGAVTQLGRTGRQYILGIQLTRAGDWDVDLCLAEAGIYLEERWNDGKGPSGW